MKVVLFCGGLGTRLREHSETVPKPLVNIGARPIVWHLMKYYAHFGHREFILCLGYRGDLIRQFFLNYDARDAEYVVMDRGIAEVALEESDVHDWRIHFVDTGLNSNIGQRLMAVREFIENDAMFLANYSDQVSDLPLDKYLDWFAHQTSIASFVAVKPSQSFHIVTMGPGGCVSSVQRVADTETWINGGFMAFRHGIFDYINFGEELVEEPFQRLIDIGGLSAYRYAGFWKAMDTLKDKIAFDEIDASGERPWTVWKR